MRKQIVIWLAGGILGGLVLVGGGMLLFFHAEPGSQVQDEALMEESRLAERLAGVSDLAKPVALQAAPPAAPATVALSVNDLPNDLSDDDLFLLMQENEELSMSNARLEAQIQDILNWILDNFKGKRPLSELDVKKLKLTAVDESFSLHPDVIDFLHITPDEESLLNDAFSYVGNLLLETEYDHMVLSNPRPDRAVIRIPAFPEEGLALQEDLYEAMAQTLGSDRFSQFLDVSQEGLNNQFKYFGNADHTLVFELLYTDDSEYPLVQIKDGWIIDDPDQTRHIEITEASVDHMPEAYAPYAALLPDAFQLPLAE